MRNFAHFFLKKTRMKHNLRLVIISFILGLIWLPQSLRAANEAYDVWDGTTLTEVTPDADNIYTVSTAAELAWIASESQTSNFTDATIKLTAHIDLGDKKWTPIGSATRPFQGKFEGQGHLIRGLRVITGTAEIGFFGHLGRTARVSGIGISGGRILADNKDYVGALAGVCAGRISNCWSQAEIVTAGNIVGGLVGQLEETGTLIDVYSSGLILSAKDVVGGLVGSNNGGHITRAYCTGYPKNGHGFVGMDDKGKYEDCYYDRKLYYQTPLAVVEGLTPIDRTQDMFGLFAGNATWVTLEDRYPQLKSFEGTDASIVSVAPMWIDVESDDPVNHANDLTEDFTVSVADGVTWACQTTEGKQWIQISGENVQVVRPCTETYILVDVKKGTETRVVYLSPRRVEDLLVGSFTGEYVKICCNQGKQLSMFTDTTHAKQGVEDYSYMLVRFEIIGLDTIPKDTLKIVKGQDAFDEWYKEYNFPTDDPGDFVLRLYVHDEGCVLDWIQNEGEFPYSVYPPFNAGTIDEWRDTIILTTKPYVVPDINEILPAGGGNGIISYTWYVNGDIVGNGHSLSGYEISEPGVYDIVRAAQDANSECGGGLSEGGVTIVAYDPFDPGEVNEEENKEFCSVEDAKTYIVRAGSAEGGSHIYEYQWYLVNGTDSTAINGATNVVLPLSDMNLEAGKSYVFVRKAQDNTRFTSWTVSRKRQRIYIMKVLDPGAIKSAELGLNCVIYGAETTTVTIAEAQPATGEPNLEYRWLQVVNGVETIIPDATGKSLDYTFKMADVVEGDEYTFIREVRQGECDWLRATGKVTQTFGQNSKGEATFAVCDIDLPYEKVWYDSDGTKFSKTFRSDGDTWDVVDLHSPNGCRADTTFTLHVIESPKITIDPDARLCQNSGDITFYFDAESGDPDVFYITYSNDLAKFMGRADTLGFISAPGTIILHNVPALGEGDMYLFVQLGSSGGFITSFDDICYSVRSRVNIYASLGGYVHSKYNRVLFVDNNPENGELPGQKLKFKTYQWYKNGVLQPNQTGQYYHENGKELNGVYYVLLTDEDNVVYRSCEVIMPNERSSAPEAERGKVYPVPVGSGEPLTIICDEGSALIVSTTGECVTRVPHISAQTTVSAPRQTGVYYVRIEYANGTVDIQKLIVK